MARSQRSGFRSPGLLREVAAHIADYRHHRQLCRLLSAAKLQPLHPRSTRLGHLSLGILQLRLALDQTQYSRVHASRYSSRYQVRNIEGMGPG